MKIIRVEGDKLGVNFSTFVIETDKELSVKFAYKVDNYSIYVNKRVSDKGYIYNVSYVINDLTKFIPRNALLKKDLIK